MKKNDLVEIKKLEETSLKDRAKLLKGKIADLIMDKNMGKLKNVKVISNSRKDLAQILTILRQKQLLSELESKVESSSEIEKSSKKKGVVA